ncbi:precorrin-6A synthase (deacetylating) [Zymobacter sp. IVIA_12111.31 C1]|uniref:precorrin-6A synthase (deacetylating) n=1 Tax=Zymobacter sp. IVIA_12111.31 C1 TaxID=3394854 RepID=UPI0039C10E57
MSDDRRHLLLIGIGAGDPQQLTLQAIDALNRTDVFFMLDKGQGKDELLHFREAICRRHIAPDHDYRIVTLPNPPRPQVPYGAKKDDAYRAIVAEWHHRRSAMLADAIQDSLLPGQTGAFLVWGDPSLFDSTIRLIDRLSVTTTLNLSIDVIPGITSVQMLCALHRIPLNQIGESVLITTGRKLQQLIDEDEYLLPATTVVMLDGNSVFQHIQRDDLMLYWGANLGTEHQALISGPLQQVAPQALAGREEVKTKAGWVMDVFILIRKTLL